MKRLAFSLALASSVLQAVAQVPDAPASGGGGAPTSPGPVTQAPPANQSSAPRQGGGLLGGDAPMFNPGNEVLTWDGKSWNINNNRVFEARFEKYLNAPEETTADDKAYQAIIQAILGYLAPGNASQQNIDLAFRLLPRASNYDIDAHLCDSLADAVYTVWTAQRQQQRLLAANTAMQYEVMSLEASTRHQVTVTEHERTAKANLGTGGNNGGGRKGGGNNNNGGAAQAAGTSVPEQAGDAKSAALDSGGWQTRRLAEMLARQKSNEVKRELSEIQAKVEFQALILQLFLQRRFQHVLMATRFYRSLFNDGDTKLNVGKDTKDLFSRGAGMPPTVSTLDAMANEAMRDVREGVQAYQFLMAKNEMQSGTKRLAEAFTVGEYLPEIRTLPRESKRRALEFSQKSYQLMSALEVKDYSLAEKLVAELATTAHDFDASKPSAAIETARTVAGFKLLHARNMAAKGDSVALERDLQEATEIWPRNPALKDFAQKISDGGNVQLSALSDFDQLYRQKNYRQVFGEKERFMAAMALYPERKGQLEEVITQVQKMDTAIYRAQEMCKQNNYAGAWESVEQVTTEIPDDSKLNQVRADLTTKASEFVRTVQGAQDLEKKDQVGSALAWYLKAQKLYPMSDFAQQGIDRLKKQILSEE